MFRYRLCTLLIVLALGPPMIAVLYWANQKIAVEAPPRKDLDAEQQELKQYRERKWVRDDDGTWHDPSIPQRPD